VSEYSLIHFNVVRPLGDFSVETTESRYFFEQLGQLVGQAKAHDGLLWHRHGLRSSDQRTLEFYDIVSLKTCGENNPHIFTLAGWRDVNALHSFAYRQQSHIESMKRLRHWVDRTEGPTMVMWWAPKHQRISADMAWEKLCKLRADGPTAEAFSLLSRFIQPAGAPE